MIFLCLKFNLLITQSESTKEKKYQKQEMDTITDKEIKQLAQECLNQIKSDDLYRVRNDAKLRAVNSAKCYEEFKWEYFRSDFSIKFYVI